MTPAERDALRALAEKATPGPWGWWCNVKSKLVYLATQNRGRVFVMTFRRFGMDSAQPCFQRDQRMVAASAISEPDHNGEIDLHQHADAAYIAACSPERITALLARLERMEQALRLYGVHPDSCPKGVGIGIYKPPNDARCDCGIDAALSDEEVAK